MVNTHKNVLIKILLQSNFAEGKCNLFSLGSPFPTTGSFSKTCQLLRSIFLFLLLSLSPSFSYQDASNKACIFLSSHLSAPAVEAGVCYGKWAKASEVRFLAVSVHNGSVCVCVCAREIWSREEGGVTKRLSSWQTFRARKPLKNHLVLPLSVVGKEKSDPERSTIFQRHRAIITLAG